MAERLSVKEILAAVRRAGPAQPEAAPLSQAEREAGPPDQDPAELADLSAAPEPPELAPAPPAPAAPPPNVPTPSSLGRPLTLKEKLAAARAGGAAAPAAPPPVTPDLPPAAEAPPPAAAAAPAPAAPPPDVPTLAALGRPLTLKEKLAAARAGGAGAAAAPAAPAPAGAKPAAKAAPTAKPAAAARVLPPLEKMSDPRDLAEALRRAGAERQKAAPSKAEPAKAKHAAKPKAVPPRPARDAALAAAQDERRGFLKGLSVSALVLIGWGSFTAGLAAFTAMMGRFMFPNVLAEPPSTIKVGLPSNFEKDEVNERWKAEWGFWIVRSAAYNGQDTIYAIQSVCTHLGCPPNWLAGEQKFKCPCHGSGFYISGINFEGPAPRPLERFKIGVGDDGNIVVDKSQKFQEELGQWADPDSFIPV